MIRGRTTLNVCAMVVGLSLGFDDLYIVGCGVLGQRAGDQWLKAHPQARVVGETASPRQHEALKASGIRPLLRGDRGSEAKCAYLLICTPPSGYDSGEQYAAEISSAAAECWDGSGGLVMTSSGGVFAEDGGGVCTEVSPTLDTERAQKLLTAERAALEAGGAVIRLAGLYALRRGAHQFWFAKGTVEAKENALVNLLSYDDAAAASVAALRRALPGDLLLAADMQPRTRAAIVEAARRHPDFRDRSVTFTQVAGNDRGPRNLGRRYDCSFTKGRIGWQPRYPCVEDFFDHHA